MEWDFQFQLVFMNLNKLYIIGGASSGLGNEYAKILAKKHKVIGLYHSSKIKNNKNLNFYKIDLEKKKRDFLIFYKK